MRFDYTRLPQFFLEKNTISFFVFFYLYFFIISVFSLETNCNFYLNDVNEEKTSEVNQFIVCLGVSHNLAKSKLWLKYFLSFCFILFFYLICCILYKAPRRKPGWRFSAGLSNTHAEISRFSLLRAYICTLWRKLDYEVLLYCGSVYVIVQKLLFILKFNMEEVWIKMIMKSELFYAAQFLKKLIFCRDFTSRTKYFLLSIGFFKNFV